jgi:hypothetical protein
MSKLLNRVRTYVDPSPVKGMTGKQYNRAVRSVQQTAETLPVEPSPPARGSPGLGQGPSSQDGGTMVEGGGS